MDNKTVAPDRRGRAVLYLLKFAKVFLHLFSTVATPAPGDPQCQANYRIYAKNRYFQKLILDIKVNKTMKHYQGEIPSMIEDIDKFYENCRLHAVSFNKVADKIKNA